MDDEQLLLAEYKFFTDSFWKNEELGERRVNFFITVTTAVLAAVVALVTSEHAGFSDDHVCQIATVALFGALAFGFVTYLRMLRRNQVTDEYKDIINHLRQELRKRSSTLAEYDLPFNTPSIRLFRGGLADTVSVMNAIIFIVIALLWCPWIWVLLGAPIVLLASLTFHPFAKAVKRRKDPRAPTFRAGVGALITHPTNNVLALERKDVPDSWQLPQGGLVVGETPLQAVKREIREETGIEQKNLRLLSDESCLLAYELPSEHQSAKTGRGQVLHWFFFRYEGTDADITLGDMIEFKDWNWIAMDDLVATVAAFKKPMYQQLAEAFRAILRRAT